MPLIEAAIWSKTDLLSKKNALHYTQINNETFRRYAPYSCRGMEEKPICSPRRMPFFLHTVTTKRFGDVPLIGAVIWSKIRFALQEKCLSLYRLTINFSEMCPL